MANLFERNSLTDGTQVTVPRWLQEGSIIFNYTGSHGVGNSTSIKSVTTGKYLFVETIWLSRSNAYQMTVQLKDDGYGGDIKVQSTLINTENPNVLITLNPPMKFEVDVFLNVGGTVGGTFDMILTGWEEDI
jgi:hypothetical protein